MKKIILSSALTLALSATSALAFWSTPATKSSDKNAALTSEAQMKQIDQMVGFPAIRNAFEKKMVRMLYELRDDPEYRTHTYITTMDGKLIKICDSIGFGFNASIQFSNPQKVVDFEAFVGSRVDTHLGVIPQAEPNGLFMPEGLAATYAICLDPTTEELKPVYIENEIIVSPFELN